MSLSALAMPRLLSATSPGGGLPSALLLTPAQENLSSMADTQLILGNFEL
jgi:hypothetical protein